MPFMQVTKQESELLDYIRKMEAVDVMDVGRILQEGSQSYLKESYPGSANRNSYWFIGRRLLDFSKVFMESNKKYRELGE